MKRFPSRPFSRARGRNPGRAVLFVATICAAACGSEASSGSGAEGDLVAFTGARVWPGSGSTWIEDATLVTRGGRVVSLEAGGPVPGGVEVVELDGRWVIPGLIDAHAHVNGDWADLGDDASEGERLEADLLLYARHGVTTVNSLGGIPVDAAWELREVEEDGPPGRARLQFAGAVVTGPTADDAHGQTAANAAGEVDWIKFRVDDNLGSATPMPWPAVEAALAEAEAHGIPVAAHIFYRDDAERLLELGVEMIAHSVRDVPVSEATLEGFRRAGACYVPTLAREITTFAYAERPDWFDDPLFQRWADPETIARVTDPEFQAAMGASASAAAYREGLEVAKENLDRLSGAGVPVAMGTDAGPPNRFPGFMEHLELELMVEAGLSPAEALEAATAGSAECLRRDDLGLLEPGRRADFVVLSGDPLADIRATREVTAVYIGGAPIP